MNSKNEENENEVKKKKECQYQLLAGFKKPVSSFYSFAFNANTTIFFAGHSDGKIKIYGFNSYNRLIQTLHSHTQNQLTSNEACCLLFLSKSNSLVSGRFDKSIVIWNQNNQNQWEQSQILEGHIEDVHCIINNDDQNLLISGSSDKIIKFWKKVNLNWTCEQTLQTPLSVLSLSLNTSENKLIACGQLVVDYTYIIVVEKQQNAQWLITQEIKEGCYWGKRICFTNDNQFAFQSQSNSTLEIYNYNQEQKQFIIGQKINQQYSKDFRFYFPFQFIHSKNLLVIKHGKYLNLYEKDLNGVFNMVMSIDFQDYYFFGKLTQDGQYIITWDSYSYCIQIRKFKQIK